MAHTPPPPAAGSVLELVNTFLEWADAEYAGGKSHGEAVNVRHALRPVVALYGGTPAADFRAAELLAVRAHMVAAGLARSTVNARTNRIRRVWRRGVEWQLVPPDTLVALDAVATLRRGRGGRDTDPVRLVPDADVAATLEYLSPDMAALVVLMHRTGMRRGEAVQMRTADLDMAADPWLYRPQHHKTEHHGHTRVVPLDAVCVELLRRFIRPIVPEAFLFSADDGDTPFRGDSVYRAVSRACRRAGVPAWHPHQLRHAYATRVRRATGSLEYAAAALGQRSLDAAAIYAERDERLAVEAMRAAWGASAAPGRAAGSDCSLSLSLSPMPRSERGGVGPRESAPDVLRPHG
jgi:integrase